IQQVIGRSLGLSFPPKRNLPTTVPIVLEVKNLQLAAENNPVSFSVKKGEIVGVFGLVGSGRTEMMRAIIGADSKHAGNIFLNGKEITILNPRDAYKYGIGLLPEDRKTQGLILPFSVEENISLNNIKKEWIDFKYTQDNARKKIGALSIKTPNSQTPVVNLSGGNQQKVIISRWLSTNCEILIFDEPTRGIDVGAKDEIYKIMAELTEQGKSIILISSELEEILGMSDRILVIRQNDIQAELSGTVQEAEVMAYAVGGVK
ncbi:MAG: ATP-binding cassette domain-containing protein, partial [Treponemataceae bacterium]